MSNEAHNRLKERIQGIISTYPWVWNDLAKVIAITWRDDIKKLGHEPELLSAEGLLTDLGRNKLTDPELINAVYKELQINNNSTKLTMEKQAHRIPILNHLQSGKTLTGKQAWDLFGCYRLSSVINRLNKNPANNIICTIVDGENYGEYSIPKEAKKKISVN